ncbi:hypothetical protein PHSY_005079 [Pseudozyma hubeiensis SY62]|uniref:Uncharacterized protein n=1 Tax=Pseudozyma hubeiensis (strain SY62) TaxID=1305764 RepID=R9P7W5_PSEHS|nr:hypothetical protein PHSY_005079 [Pseudozyma hubeiensis SY62]GAC97493.1 hypothetical protein PHSY_005079 [Pseudozyma hubeiensis SY62]
MLAWAKVAALGDVAKVRMVDGMARRLSAMVLVNGLDRIKGDDSAGRRSMNLRWRVIFEVVIESPRNPATSALDRWHKAALSNENFSGSNFNTLLISSIRYPAVSHP